jgi:hypothetical protein
MSDGNIAPRTGSFTLEESSSMLNAQEDGLALESVCVLWIRRRCLAPTGRLVNCNAADHLTDGILKLVLKFLV